MKDIVVAISGMSCGHCLNAVNKALAKLETVEVRSVRMGRAELRVLEGDAATAEVYAAIEDAGYKIEGISPG